MNASIIIVSILYLVLPSTAFPEETQWASFKLAHDKAYADSAEEARRFQIFRDNLRTIRANNELFERGDVPYKLGVNKFADVSPEEFGASIRANARKWNLKLEDRNLDGAEIVEEGDDGGVPDAMDWRDRGAVTGVMDETFCYNGYSWAFSVIAAVETQHFLTNGALESLSGQQLIDCADPADNIDPWYQNFAFAYLKKNSLAYDDGYPYTCSVDPCKSQGDEVRVTLSSAKDLVGEQSLKNHCGANGTISVYIDASRLAQYQGGVIDGTLCGNRREDLNHAALVVGYGEEESGKKYWILKNSWGVNWGEDGYMRIARSANNTCGVAWSPVIPTIYK